MGGDALDGRDLSRSEGRQRISRRVIAGTSPGGASTGIWRRLRPRPWRAKTLSQGMAEFLQADPLKLFSSSDHNTIESHKEEGDGLTT